MTPKEKSDFMHNAFSRIVKDLMDEGKVKVANQTTKALLGVPDDSMAKLYDILHPKVGTLDQVLGPDENIGSC